MPDPVAFACRSHCGACCIAPSIRQPFYGMPQGKAAGEACVHLEEGMRCSLFGDSRRPALCAAFMAEPSVCGKNRDQAMALLLTMEADSAPECAL